MPAPGDRFDRFVVEEQLGRGGMAAVYRVRHATLGSAHALKVLDVPLPAIRTRLVQEGRMQASLGHPNIVAVTDLIEVEGAPGLIMELVAGPSLDVWLRTHRASPAVADALFRGILDGVGFAHRQGLVHRDLKPGNVLLLGVDDRLVPKVADFGLAKVLGDGGSGTRTGFAMGTPGYMAPEQIRNAKEVDGRADVFALGCILYELWAGRPAFPGHDLFDILPRVEGRDYPPVRSLRPEVPEAVERAIAACLEPDLALRLPSCESVRAVLDGLDPGLARSRGTAPAVGPAVPVGPPPHGSGGLAPATFPGVEATEELALSMEGPAPVGATTGARTGRRGSPGLGVLALGGAVVAALCAGAVGIGWVGARVAGEPERWDPGTVGIPEREGVIPEVGEAVDRAPAVAAPGASSAAADPGEGAAGSTRRAPPALATSPASPAASPAAPVVPAVATAPVTAAFTVAGEADGVWLESGGRRLSPGRVAPGTYAIKARFGEAVVVIRPAYALSGGQSLTVTCSRAFSNCDVTAR